MAFFGENWDDAEFPQAYLITIRTHGTWLHGDRRFSVDSHGTYNVFGAPKRPINAKLVREMSKNMAALPVKLNIGQRRAVHGAITEVCKNREYILHSLNVRTNHAHVVVTAQTKPEPTADSFKAYATRRLREDGLIDREFKVWSRGRSRRYLWKSHHVEAAIDYVLCCQEDYPFEDWYSSKFDD